MKLIRKFEELNNYIESEKQLYALQKHKIFRVVIEKGVLDWFNAEIIENGVVVSKILIDRDVFNKLFLVEIEVLSDDIFEMLFDSYKKVIMDSFDNSKQWYKQ